MNNMNMFDPNKLIDTKQCQYFVDISSKSDVEKDEFSPRDLVDWSPIYSKEFLDADNSKVLGRVFAVPQTVAKLGEQYASEYWNKVYEVLYLDYCLFERNSNNIDESSNI